MSLTGGNDVCRWMAGNASDSCADRPWSAVLTRATASLAEARQLSNEALGSVEPLQLVALTLLCAAVAIWLVAGWQAAMLEVRAKGLVPAIWVWLFAALKTIPGVKGAVERQQKKVVAKMQASESQEGSGSRVERRELPEWGLGGEEVMALLRERREGDKAWRGKCSGTVYFGGESYDTHMKLVADAFAMFAHTNPLHVDVFPSVNRCEKEVVAMTAALLQGRRERGASKDTQGNAAAPTLPSAPAPVHPLLGPREVVGNMSSGGSESIVLAVKATRDFMREKRGITKPEILVPVSGHAAYDKAAAYLGINLITLPVNPHTLQADVAAARRLISSRTILIVASAPGFPHGVIDPIEELSALALSARVCLHVDCCLGGFVLPFARELGYPIPPFDFALPGVTSISIDTHKYGLAPKGTSVVLYRSRALRKCQFHAITEWSGGLYVSPSVAGSRPGALIAGTWAAMMSIGMHGYLDITRTLIETTHKVIKGVSAIDGLTVLGAPVSTVVAFAASHPSSLDIYKVNDAISALGWSLNALHKPAALHICITLQHIDTADQFLQDLQSAVTTVKNDPSAFPHGMAPIYGAGAVMPDRTAVGDLLVEYMDSQCG